MTFLFMFVFVFYVLISASQNKQNLNRLTLYSTSKHLLIVKAENCRLGLVVITCQTDVVQHLKEYDCK